MNKECCDKCYSNYTSHDWPAHTTHDACLDPGCPCHQPQEELKEWHDDMTAVDSTPTPTSSEVGGEKLKPPTHPEASPTDWEGFISFIFGLFVEGGDYMDKKVVEYKSAAIRDRLNELFRTLIQQAKEEAKQEAVEETIRDITQLLIRYGEFGNEMTNRLDMYRKVLIQRKEDV